MATLFALLLALAVTMGDVRYFAELIMPKTSQAEKSGYDMDPDGSFNSLGQKVYSTYEDAHRLGAHKMLRSSDQRLGRFKVCGDVFTPTGLFALSLEGEAHDVAKTFAVKYLAEVGTDAAINEWFDSQEDVGKTLKEVMGDRTKLDRFIGGFVAAVILQGNASIVQTYQQNYPNIAAAMAPCLFARLSRSDNGGAGMLATLQQHVESLPAFKKYIDDALKSDQVTVKTISSHLVEVAQFAATAGTSNLAHSLFVELARNESLRAYVCAPSNSSEPTHQFITEVARLRAPVNRIGQTLDGAWRSYHIGMVSRDPKVFPNPDVMDLMRDHSKTLSFNEISSERICGGKSVAISFLRRLVQEGCALGHFTSKETLEWSGIGPFANTMPAWTPVFG